MSDDEEYYEEDNGYNDGNGGDDYGYQEQQDDGGGYQDNQYEDQNRGQYYQGYDNNQYEDQNRGYDGQYGQGYDNNQAYDSQDYGQGGYDGSYGQQQQQDYQDYDDNNQYEDQNDILDEPEPEEYHQEDGEDEEEDDGEVTQVAAHTNAASDGDNGTNDLHGMGSMIKGAMDGFGGGGFDGVVGQIGSLISQGGGAGGLTNVFSSGGLEGIVGNLISSASHQFFGINPATGAIIGAIAGNVIFNLGGQNNSLSGIGKVILDNIISGKFKRDIQPFVPGGPSGGLAFSEQFQPIDFEQERQRCLSQRILFEDPQFPANDSSLYYKTRPDEPIVWKRPGEIYENPQLIVGEKSRFDVKQGALGDCWLLAAVANLTLRDELFYRVVPPNQSFTENYAGIFHFQFWRYGQWVDVVIDDRLPTVGGRLCYMRSHENNEFWSALLEKAYAKLYGGYENLDGGTTAEALEDFTGGLTEFFDLTKADKATTLAMLVRGMQMGSLFGCSIDADENVKEAQLTNGLVRGHAYSITAIHTVNTYYNGQIPLLRIRNPWGNSKEWNGAWSDGSAEWNGVDGGQREQMGVNFSKDGEFWMSFDDFMHEFTQMEVCNLSADVMDEISEMTGVEVNEKQKHQWVEKQQDGEWNSRRGTAGGCQNNETYCNNPQYGTYFQVPHDSVENDGKCTVIAAVLQKYRRELRSKNLDNLAIGFSVYKADGGQAMSNAIIRSEKPIARTKVFINMREVTVRFRIHPGAYVIVPCTFDAYDDAAFLLRVYANAGFETTQLR
uniref:Calpain catalytic domain-containing protein n=1 Tax=Caenorhabditis japonica TaxID=281687 RepID=A0A8R1HGA8_CAEJA